MSIQNFPGSFPVPPFKFSFEKLIKRCHNAMKFGVVNKSTTVNRFVLHTLQRNITHLAVITRNTYIKLGILKGGKLEKSHFPLPFLVEIMKCSSPPIIMFSVRFVFVLSFVLWQGEIQLMMIERFRRLISV